MVKARALKTPITVDRFWLLPEEETETFIKVNSFLNNSENNPDNSRKKDDNYRKNDTKGKEKKGKYIYTAPPDTYFEDPSLNDIFLLFLKSRQNKGEQLTEDQIRLLVEEILSVSSNPDERITIIKKSIMNGWKGFYPVKKKKASSKNRFNNFHQRDYDFADYERCLLNQGPGGDEDGRKRSVG